MINPLAWWGRRLGSGSERQVLAAGVIVRVGAVALLAYGVPLDWPHLRHPPWALLLPLTLAAETAVVVSWWIRRGAVLWPVAVELPTGVAAIVVSGVLSADNHIWTGYVLWTGYAFPYTVVAAVTFGLVYRSFVPVLLSGIGWGVTAFAVAVGIDRHGVAESLFVVLPYLIFPTVGRSAAGLLRDGVARLDAAREVAAAQAAEIATERERARHARALHDRVLQTMETLARTRLVADPARHRVLVAQAAWLRRFVETGALDLDDDLPAELSAATLAVAATGVVVELNDAALRTAAPRLSEPARTALIEATHHALADLATGASGAVVRAERHDGGVLVSILPQGARRSLDEEDLDRVRTRLAAVGGRLTVEPVPYAELWVPGINVAAAE